MSGVGRPLFAAFLFLLLFQIESGYPYAAYDCWRGFSLNSSTLARSVCLAADPPSTQFTRQVIERTMQETIREMLSDKKVEEMIKRATIKKLKHRLQFTK